MVYLQPGERRGDAGGVRAAVRHPPRDVINQHAPLCTIAKSRHYRR